MAETIYPDLSGNNSFGVHLNDDSALLPTSMLPISQAGYDAIVTPDPNILYVITNAGAIVKFYHNSVEYS